MLLFDAQLRGLKQLETCKSFIAPSPVQLKQYVKRGRARNARIPLDIRLG